MEIIEIKSSKDKYEFNALPTRINNGGQSYIKPLISDVEAVFNPKINKSFRNGEAIRWILVKEGRTVGRIAAFYNNKLKNKDNDQPTGGIGFFDCINDQEAANILFGSAKKWLEKRGLEAMDGPINFGERDKWWGLLIEGFDIEPNYCCNYNPPYYRELFENYGFQVYFKQFTYARKIHDPLSENVHEKASRITRNPDFTFEHLRKSHIDKYTEDFRTIYNRAWVKHKGVAEMPLSLAKSIMKKLKPIMDEKIIWFGYHKNDPIAFFIMIPEFNQIVKHLNGKLDLMGKIKFLYHKWNKTCRKILALVFGVVPEHQGKGVEGAIVLAVRKLLQDEYLRYDEMEMNWIGDFNPKMMRVAEHVGGKVCKIHHTYRKLFDESKPFKRASMKNE